MVRCVKCGALNEDNSIICKSCKYEFAGINGIFLFEVSEETCKKYQKIDYNAQGYAYQFGSDEVNQDYKKAFEVYKKVAEQGDADGQYNLGYMLFNGQGTAQNYEEAALWFQKSAEQGNAVAQYMLGFMYQHGLGVTLDIEKARHWYTMAANNGYELASEKIKIIKK